MDGSQITGESSLANLPEIVDPEAEGSNDEDDEDEEDREPEQTLEEKLTELVQNLLHKTASVAIKAMKDLEQMVSMGENVQELMNCAEQLVDTIREEFHGELNYKAPTHVQLVNFLLLRFEEERVNMKKAAITALQALFLQLHDQTLVNPCAERLALKCRDLALAVRKQAAHALTHMLKRAPEFERLRSTWLHAVMHLIVDREPSVQQYAAKLISEMLLEPIVHDDDALVWTLLTDIEGEAGLRRLLLRTLDHLHKDKSLPKQLVKVVQRKANAAETNSAEQTNACWMLLSELSSFLPVPPADAIDHWANRLDLSEPNRLIGYMAKLIANRAEQLTSFTQHNTLKNNLHDALMQHKVHPSYISAVYHLYARVLKAVGGGMTEKGPKELEQFNQYWYGHSLRALDKTVYMHPEGGMSEQEITGYEEQLEAQIRAARGDTSEQEPDDLDETQTVMFPLASPARSILQSPASYRGSRPPMRTPTRNCGNSNDDDEADNRSENSDNNNGGNMMELSGTINENCERLIRLITSIGECIQYTPALISKRLFRILQVIIASDVLQKIHQEHMDFQGTNVPTTPNIMSRVMSPNTSFHTELPALAGPQSVAPSQFGVGSPTHTMYTAGGGVASKPNQIRIGIKKRIFRCELMSRQVRATAVITLGKLCLQDEPLAKRCIPVFMRELKQNEDHFVRNNIVVVICDLCIRYTSMVDRYSTLLASCLRDQSLLIRRQTLMLLTNLIKEQYLKWEGPIIYRFVTTLFDSDPCIQEYAKFCLTDILLPQFKERMFFHHFLECMFNFNGIIHATSVMRDPDFELINAELDKQCSLEGRGKFEDRMYLYKYMLNTFEDQQKVSILEKIGVDVFLPVVEGGMRLSDLRVRNLLFDAFKVMGTAEIRLKMQLGKLDVDYEGPDDDEPPELVKTAAKKFISTTFRKTIAEAVMPHLFAMNAFLTEKHSPMAKHCYAVILDMCHEHEEQLDDFLASDPRLKAEVRFDLKQRFPHAHRNTGGGSRSTPSRPVSRATSVATVR